MTRQNRKATLEKPTRQIRRNEARCVYCVVGVDAIKDITLRERTVHRSRQGGTPPYGRAFRDVSSVHWHHRRYTMTSL